MAATDRGGEHVVSDAASAYIATLPAARRETVSAVRDLVNANLQPGFEEGTGGASGMIRWTIPPDVSPRTYNNEPLSLAWLGNRKEYVSLYLMNLVHDGRERAWFEQAWRATGKRLNLGKVTVRFRSLEDLAIDVVAEHIRHTTVDVLVAAYELAWSR